MLATLAQCATVCTVEGSILDRGAVCGAVCKVRCVSVRSASDAMLSEPLLVLSEAIIGVALRDPVTYGRPDPAFSRGSRFAHVP